MENDEFDSLAEVDSLFQPLTEEEENELTEFFEPFPGKGAGLAKLHGLLSALAAGPRPPSPTELLPTVLKARGDSPVGKQAVPQQINVLLGRFYDGIIDDIASDTFTPRLQPPGIQVTDVVSDISSWCQGFVLGIEQAGRDWKRWFNDLRREKAIAIIFGTANPPPQQKIEKAGAEKLAWMTQNMISDLVPLIARYWHFESGLDQYLGPEPATPVPKVGRNDPCPCGSGKKYKQCCGKAQ